MIMKILKRAVAVLFIFGVVCAVFFVIQIIVLLGIMIYNTLKAWTVPESITTAYFMNLLLISGGAVLSVLTWLSQKNKTLI